MPAFVYQCPTTGFKVQGFIEDFVADDTVRDVEAFVPVTCTICTRVHLVNPKTGRVLGD